MVFPIGLRRADVLVLGALRAATEEEDIRFPFLPAIDPITWAIVNPQFQKRVEKLEVPQRASPKVRDPLIDHEPGLGVLDRMQPFRKRLPPVPGHIFGNGDRLNFHLFQCNIYPTPESRANSTNPPPASPPEGAPRLCAQPLPAVSFLPAYAGTTAGLQAFRSGPFRARRAPPFASRAGCVRRGQAGPSSLARCALLLHNAFYANPASGVRFFPDLRVKGIMQTARFRLRDYITIGLFHYVVRSR